MDWLGSRTVTLSCRPAGTRSLRGGTVRGSSNPGRGRALDGRCLALSGAARDLGALPEHIEVHELGMDFVPGI